MGDTFDAVRADFERQLQLEYHSTDTTPIFALAKLARDKKHGNAARELLLGGFERLVKRKNKDKLINDVAYHALAWATMDMPKHASIGPALHAAFRVAAELTKTEVHYNMNVTCGPLAIALATFDYREAIPDLAKFREKFDHYDGTAFHTQVLYAQWIFEDDGAGAAAYLEESDQLKILGWPAAAMADMDYKAGRASLRKRLLGKLHAESREALLEASDRLIKQKKRPATDKRMIYLFGRVSLVEIALGNESENTFRDRAIAKRG